MGEIGWIIVLKNIFIVWQTNITVYEGRYYQKISAGFLMVWGFLKPHMCGTPQDRSLEDETDPLEDGISPREHLSPGLGPE